MQEEESRKPLIPVSSCALHITKFCSVASEESRNRTGLPSLPCRKLGEPAPRRRVTGIGHSAMVGVTRLECQLEEVYVSVSRCDMTVKDYVSNPSPFIPGGRP